MKQHSQSTTFVLSCVSSTPFCFCQRCSVDAIDQQGATALHVAAERGGVEVCWTLLQRTGCRMLHEKTHSGLKPLELCKQGKTFRWICRGIFIPGIKKHNKKKPWLLRYPFHICSFSWDPDADKFIALLHSFFSPDISNSPNYWVGTLMTHYITNPGSPTVSNTWSNCSKNEHYGLQCFNPNKYFLGF